MKDATEVRAGYFKLGFSRGLRNHRPALFVARRRAGIRRGMLFRFNGDVGKACGR